MEKSLVRPTVHPDLVKERNRGTFDLDAFSRVMYGEQLYHDLSRLRLWFSQNANLDLRYIWSASPRERYIRGAALARELVDIIKKYNIMSNPRLIGAVQVMAGEDMFLLLHLTMFLPCLEAMCDEEQAKYWLPLAKEFRILGTYAQTELAHGSNVPGIETVAEFRQEKDGFILNSPTPTSTKWWVGGLAKSCTHCVLMARLKIRNQDYGVHPFILQIRCLDTHKTLPGIKLYHIGQKMGFHGMDNGAMVLKNVFIPRNGMLMRFSAVDHLGNYTVKGDKRMVYSTLTFTRKQIVLACGAHLSRSVVIALRYSAIRRQFGGDLSLPEKPESAVKGNFENPILDYSTQQNILFPLLSMSVAYIFAGRTLDALYDKMLEQVSHGNFDLLAEVHCLTSCLKAYMTTSVADGIEKCRKALGGHGFLAASGVPNHFLNFVPQATYEGDFVILAIQTGRMLMKEVGRAFSQRDTPRNKIGDTFLHLYEYKIDEVKQPWAVGSELLDDPAWLLEQFKHRASVMAFQVTAEYATAAEGKQVSIPALETVKMKLSLLTVAHSQYIVMKFFNEAIQQALGDKNSSNEYRVLRHLYLCLGLYWMMEHLIEFVLAKCVNPEAYSHIERKLAFIYSELRPNAVTLSDSFHHSDRFLNSALGRFDGHVYEALLDSLKDEKMNEKDVSEAYHAHIQYILHPERITKNSKL